MKTKQLIGRMAVVLVMGGITLSAVTASDLDNFCSDWEAKCSLEPDYVPPPDPCPDPVPITGLYDIAVEIHTGAPPNDLDANFPEARVKVTNTNAAIRVKVYRSGIVGTKNIYFQVDQADDHPACDPFLCSLEVCPEPPEGSGFPDCCDDDIPNDFGPCHFDGECCEDQEPPGTNCVFAEQTCPGPGPDPEDGCNVMLRADTCGCEIAMREDTLEVAGDDDDSKFSVCDMPKGGDSGCDNDPEDLMTPQWCVFLSPSLENGGAHFRINEINFSSGDCWYAPKIMIGPNLGPPTIGQAEITVDVLGECKQQGQNFDGSNLPRVCPDINP